MLALCLVGIFVISGFSSAQAQQYQYNQRFIRSYPPGYYGMWYYSEKFREQEAGEERPEEYYRWDNYMSRVTGITYPFTPKPYDWSYGSDRTFNMPDYNTNDWR
jgi:hypothetical protein